AVADAAERAALRAVLLPLAARGAPNGRRRRAAALCAVLAAVAPGRGPLPDAPPPPPAALETSERVARAAVAEWLLAPHRAARRAERLRACDPLVFKAYEGTQTARQA